MQHINTEYLTKINKFTNHKEASLMYAKNHCHDHVLLCKKKINKK